MTRLDVDAIVVDVDDTLYLERDYVRSGFVHVGQWLAEEHGVHGVEETAWRLFCEGARRTTIGDALSLHGADPELLSHCVEQYRSHRPHIRMLSDAADFIGTFAGTARFSAVTDGPAESQRAKCEALGLASICSPLVVTAEWGLSKPDVRVFVRAVAGWGIPPERIVYVADNPTKDFQGPLALGWQTLRVRRPLSLHAQEPTPPGIPEVESLAGLA